MGSTAECEHICKKELSVTHEAGEIVSSPESNGQIFNYKRQEDGELKPFDDSRLDEIARKHEESIFEHQLHETINQTLEDGEMADEDSAANVPTISIEESTISIENRELLIESKDGGSGLQATEDIIYLSEEAVPDLNEGVQDDTMEVETTYYQEREVTGTVEQDDLHVIVEHCLQETESARKRKRDADNGPSVLVTYKGLTSESQRKLQDLLRQWAEWDGHEQDSQKRSIMDGLSGSEMYFPALRVGKTNGPTVHFWMDRPAKRPRLADDVESQEKEAEVPLYDRVCNNTLTAESSGLNNEGYLEIPEEASRCFNCGSYSHGLRDCPRPRDAAAIYSARKMHSSKRPQRTSRYYESSPGGKFDDLKPGILGSETRQSLGIGELDPPPWLNRMRELGYPPGYIDEDNESSGICIFGEDDENNTNEEGEIIEKKPPPVRESSSNKKKLVDFPGINAPIPDNADFRLWSSSPDTHRRSNNLHLSASAALAATALLSPSDLHSGHGKGGEYYKESRLREQNYHEKNETKHSDKHKSYSGSGKWGSHSGHGRQDDRRDDRWEDRWEDRSERREGRRSHSDDYLRPPGESPNHNRLLSPQTNPHSPAHFMQLPSQSPSWQGHHDNRSIAWSQAQAALDKLPSSSKRHGSSSMHRRL